MSFDLKRRDFITLLGSAVAGWPLAARAQQPTRPVIGFLSSRSPGEAASVVAAFQRGLKDTGYVEGQNYVIEFRWAEGQLDRLPKLATELVNLPVSVIFAGGGGITALAAKAATSTIPVVFTNGEDPVKSGLVSSLSRPGGNLTGSTFFTIELGPKRVDLLRELAPNARRIALLINPKSANVENATGITAVEASVRAHGQEPIIVSVGPEGDFDAAFGRIVEQRVDGLLLISDPLFTSHRDVITALAARHGLPTLYPDRQYVAEGGLISYGASTERAYRQSGNYIGKILRGAIPADLPVLQPTGFELVINLKSASALRLTIPPSLLALADEVIE